MDLLSLFRTEGEHLFWDRVPDDRIAGGGTGAHLEPNRSYVVVRLVEMYLGTTRLLWRKFSPLVHGFTSYDADKSEEHTVAGPGQLQELGDANLDRVMVFNTRLAGPRPYRGGDVTLLAGLYSVPREDAATALVTTIGAIAGLAGPGAAAIPQVAEVLKKGVDSVLGLGDTKLRLGVSDTFVATDGRVRTGYHVGIGAPRNEVPTAELFVNNGRLVRGPSATAGTEYRGLDYFLIRIEAPDRRVDWPGLPGLGQFEERFSRVLADSQLSEADRTSALGEIWREFTETLATSPYLTRYDAGQIANDVLNDLKNRKAALAGNNPFETKSFGSDKVEQKRADQVDFAAIPSYGDGHAEAGEQALAASDIG
jgi:hypothetical protein